MRAGRWGWLLLLLLVVAPAADAAEVAIPAAPSAWATDTAGFLQARTIEALDARLSAYQTATGHQILVYVAPTTGDTPTEEWTERAFTRWKVGRKGLDDGLVMFVFPADRKVRIEVGYGLEQSVPDASASRIIRDTVAPKIRDGAPDQAVTAGIDALLAAIGGEAPPPAATAAPASDETDSGADPVGVVIGVVLALLIIAGIGFLISKIPQSRGPYIAGGNSGFGAWDAVSLVGGLLLGGGLGGSSGGGFSGGGGSGGGGGATGSW